MLNLVFDFGSELISIKIEGHTLLFASIKGPIVTYAPIEGLKFSERGIEEEFPDLKGKPFNQMKTEAIERFKEKIKQMKTEEEIMIFLKNDLVKHGYHLNLIHKPGFRPINADKYFERK